MQKGMRDGGERERGRKGGEGRVGGSQAGKSLYCQGMRFWCTLMIPLPSGTTYMFSSETSYLPPPTSLSLKREMFTTPFLHIPSFLHPTSLCCHCSRLDVDTWRWTLSASYFSSPFSLASFLNCLLIRTPKIFSLLLTLPGHHPISPAPRCWKFSSPFFYPRRLAKSRDHRAVIHL